jgi:hypothetical protein
MHCGELEAENERMKQRQDFLSGGVHAHDHVYPQDKRYGAWAFVINRISSDRTKGIPELESDRGYLKRCLDHTIQYCRDESGEHETQC